MPAWYWKRLVAGRGPRTVRGAPHVPVVPVQAVDRDVGDDHPDILEGVALEGDAGLLPGHAVATVA
ncbi:MAG: hypothetical protein ACRYG2_17680, partial [Janthinobacterium lividum]